MEITHTNAKMYSTYANLKSFQRAIRNQTKQPDCKQRSYKVKMNRGLEHLKKKKNHFIESNHLIQMDLQD